MENQHRKINGYRELSQEEIDLMNKIKSFGPQLQSLIHDIERYLDHKIDMANLDNDNDELERIDAAQPYRWMSIGATDLQTGLMALTRAIAQPTFF